MAKKKLAQGVKPLKWGIPDWHDATGYPKAGDDLNDAEWRWEFLRRLPEYLKDWQRLAPRLRLGRGDPARLLPTSIVVRATVEKYGLLYGLPDPRKTYGRAKPIFTDEYRFGQTQWTMSLSFDLRRPLGPQLKDAKYFLTGVQREFAKPLEREHRHLWPIYLRLLDAATDQRAGRTTWQQIGETLIPLFGRIIGPESRSRHGKPPRSEPRKRIARDKNRTGVPAASDAHNRHTAVLDFAQRYVLGLSLPSKPKRHR